MNKVCFNLTAVLHQEQLVESVDIRDLTIRTLNPTDHDYPKVFDGFLMTLCL